MKKRRKEEENKEIKRKNTSKENNNKEGQKDNNGYKTSEEPESAELREESIENLSFISKKNGNGFIKKIILLTLALVKK